MEIGEGLGAILTVCHCLLGIAQGEVESGLNAEMNRKERKKKKKRKKKGKKRQLINQKWAYELQISDNDNHTSGVHR